MHYLCSLLVILFLFSIPIDLTTLNTCLVLLLFISLSQLFLAIGRNFSKIVNDMTIESLEKNIKIYEEIKTKGKMLENWSNVLRGYNEEMTVLQLKSLFILLNDAYARQDKNVFNTIITRLKEMEVPDEKLQNQELLAKFIDDVDNKVYIAHFNQELCRSVFVLNDKNDDKNDERNK